MWTCRRSPTAGGPAGGRRLRVDLLLPFAAMRSPGMFLARGSRLRRWSSGPRPACVTGAPRCPACVTPAPRCGLRHARPAVRLASRPPRGAACVTPAPRCGLRHARPAVRLASRPPPLYGLRGRGPGTRPPHGVLPLPRSGNLIRYPSGGYNRGPTALKSRVHQPGGYKRGQTAFDSDVYPPGGYTRGSVSGRPALPPTPRVPDRVRSLAGA